jgi:hypothetical protein
MKPVPSLLQQTDKINYKHGLPKIVNPLRAQSTWDETLVKRFHR